MLLFKIDQKTIQWGVAKLQDMCNSCVEFEDIKKVRGYQRILLKQCYSNKAMSGTGRSVLLP